MQASSADLEIDMQCIIVQIPWISSLAILPHCYGSADLELCMAILGDYN